MNKLNCTIYILLVSCWCSCSSSKVANQKTVSTTTSKIAIADLLFLTPEKQLEYYQNAENLLSTNTIAAGKSKYPLIESYTDLSGFTFLYKDTLRSLNDFMKQTNVVGLIILRGDSILYEQYNHGTGPGTKWVDFSVAKSVTSLLYGVALKDGYIKSLDEKVTQFITELKGSVYDSVSLHQLLQMSSGVAWDDDTRNPNSDLLRISRTERLHGWNAAYDSLKLLKRAAPPGKRFNYNTVETTLAAIILRNAIGKPLSQYLSERVWKPFGMHADANWAKVRSLDIESGGCCISSTLRDYALLGLFALKNGVTVKGEQLLPNDWMQKSITPTPSYKGYGYYWWLHPKSGRYFASGAFGQQVEIDPSQNTIVAVQSYWPVAFGDYYLGYLDGFIEAVLNHLKTKRP